VKDIVVPVEASEDATYEYALLGPYLLRIDRATDSVEIFHSAQWVRFGLAGADVRQHGDVTILTAPALSSLVK